MNIVIPDVEPMILKKLVEYIYFGAVDLESRYMSGRTFIQLHRSDDQIH